MGATIVSSYALSDFALLRLSSSPSFASEIPFAGEEVSTALVWLNPFFVLSSPGWDRTGSNVFGRVLVGIHHPNGDEKKIAQSTTDTSSSKYMDDPSYAMFDTHVRVVWAQGKTEPGSSGSALFNPEGRIVGQLHGGKPFPHAPGEPDW
jgi:lysyl endopeptidase